MRVGLIGLGIAVAPHATSVQDLLREGRISAACGWSPSEARRTAFADKYGLPTTETLEALLDRVDAVLLLTPPNAREELVDRLAAAGKPILMEKPLERTTAAAERIVRTCRDANVRLGIVLQHRFRPASRRLRALIDEGGLGALATAQLSFPWWRPQSYYDVPGRGTLARDGGGVLISQAIHSLDLMLTLAGPVASVAAIAGTSAMHRMETEDTVGAGMRFANGALGGLFASTASFPGAGEQLTLTFTEATAILADGALQVAWRDGRSEAVQGEARSGGGADPMAFSNEAHRALIRDFLDAVEAARDPAITGEAALAVHRLIDALLRSASEGRSVAP
jgi:predicted dehydrogenase